MSVNAAILAKTQIPADYVSVAASQTAAPLAITTAAKGNLLYRIIVIPATTGAGSISLIDGTGSDKVTISLFVTGTLSNLAPITIECGFVSQKTGGWNITTGASVSILAVGLFT